MKRILNTLSVVAIISLLSQCKPYEVPEPIGSVTPVFYASGTMNGESFEWLVDGENFQSRAWSSGQGGDYTSYSGSINDLKCEGPSACGPFLMLGIRGNENFDESVVEKPYDYRHFVTPPSFDQYTITVYPEAKGSLVSCEWIVQGEVFNTIGDEPLVFERDETDSSRIKVILNSTHLGGCTSQIVDYVYLPNHGCDADIKTKTLTSNSHVLFEAEASGGFGYDYSWGFESGPFATSKEVEYQFNNIPSDGVETVELYIETNGCMASSVRNHLVDDSLASCNINFDYEIETTTIQPEDDGPIDLNTARIYFLDEEGNFFDSETVEQPSWNKFDVLEVSDYDDPNYSAEYNFKKMKVEFSARLSHPTLGIIDFTNCTAVVNIQ